MLELLSALDLNFLMTLCRDENLAEAAGGEKFQTFLLRSIVCPASD